jgi:tetratricopeptide (TPR) repeat protein
MPFTVNGIGTWYYGKRRIHTYDGTCQFCGSAGTLSSYDTTLFFVVVFVPVIPIGRKRILEECPSCRKHRVLGLKQWEATKEADVAAALDRLRRDPGDRDAAVRGIVLAAGYQDEPLLTEIVQQCAGAHRRDASFQAQLGDTYAYFARWPQAEEAYRASLHAEENESVREALTWALLKQGRPLEARPYLKHVLSGKKQQSAYLIFYLIAGYQAEGLHDEALELMDARDMAFPAQASLKECQRQRKTSIRNRATRKRIGGVSLKEGGGRGYREGNWTASLPRWIAALVFIGALGSYLGSAAWIGQARKVHLVNGTRKPYTVSVAGADFVLAPGSVKPVRVAEGEIEVLFADAKLGLSPVRAHIETSFWSRPFASHAFIINPDQTALIVQEQTIYAANPQQALQPPPPVFHFGQAFYQISGMDYEFEAFPQTLSVKGSQTITKTRVGLGPSLPDDARVNWIMQRVPDAEQIQFCERVLRLDPSNWQLLYLLTTRVDAARMRKILEARLDDRPILVEWHRAYQSTMEKAEPGTDLRPRYEKLLAETNGHADALYLLGRAEPDLDKGEKLFRQAAEADPPSGYALYGLGYRALSEGRFPEAVVTLEKAMKLLTDKMLCRPVYRDSLLAAKEYDRLLADLRADLQTPDRKLTALIGICRVHAIRGEKAEARAALAQAVQTSAPEAQLLVRNALESSLCCWENDVDGYLKAAAPAGSFETVFLQGQLQLAADLIATGPKQDADAFHGLLYLEAKRTGDKDRADVHWQALLRNLKSGGRDERRFAEGLELPKLPSDFPWQRLPLDPRVKRVLLRVLAERHPGQAKAITELADKLDYQHDAISLCLRKVVPDLVKK